MTRFGGYSSAVTVPAMQAVERPEGLDAVHAAAIPVTALTAWMMLEQMARVREGDRVLVHSAGGGVGLMALDLIKRRNAVAIGTASAHKHPFLLERGYNQVIDYRTDDFAEVLAEQAPIDIILDPVGGSSWAKGMGLLAPGGRLVCFGFSSNAVAPTRKVWSAISNLWAVPWTRFNPIWLMNHNVGVLGCNMGHMWEHSALVTRWLSELIPLWQQGQIRPVIHATFPFSQAAEAHQLIHDRQNLGKVILIPDGVT